MAISVYGLSDQRSGPWRIIWVALLGLFGYALTLTQSRGGFLALMVGSLVLIYAHFGVRRLIPLAVIILPVLFVLFAGRQTNIDLSNSGDTGHARIELWSDGLALFRQTPLFGIGAGEYAEQVGLVAHNSYVNSYTELGFFGGTFFLGAFFHALWALRRLGNHSAAWIHPELQRLRPYVMAIVAAYGAGLLSLSRAYVVPTYMIFGLAASSIRIGTIYAPSPSLRVNARFLARLGAVSVGFMIVITMMIRLFAHHE
jgi:O-antigen ligase